VRMETWTRWFKETFFKEKKENQTEKSTPQKSRLILLLICVGVLLLLINKGENPAQDSTAGLEADLSLPFSRDSNQGQEYEKALEQRLESFLSTIKGVGSVKVMVVMERAEEQVFSLNTTEKTTKSEESSTADGQSKLQTETNITTQHVLLRDDQGRTEKPLLKTVLAPKVSGVVVTAKGAADPAVCYKITTALQSLLGIGAHRIEVLEKE
jgi:stage III sporulation protein AG